MSKGEGKKIVIKFTKDLVGDVSGNESAMTITGQEFQHVDGPLLDKEYLIEEMARYGLRKLWELSEEKELNFTMVPGGETNVSNLGNPMAHSEYSSSYAKELAFDNSLSGNGWYASGTIGRWIGLDFGLTPQVIKSFKIYVGDGRFKGFVFEGSNNNTDWAILASGNLASAIAWESVTFENSVAYRYCRIRCTSVYTGSNLGVKELEIYVSGEVITYDNSTVYTFDNLPLQETRIMWTEIVPTDTSITIEYKIDVDWVVISKNDIMPIAAEIRAILATTDNSVTPILLSLWLEELNAPQNKLLITFGDISTNRFNNVEGNLTVNYDSSIGSLLGAGGLVESFTESFLPLDLIPKPNPHESENITVGIADLIFDVKEVSYIGAFKTDNITTGITDIVFTVTKIDDNPL